MIHETIDQGIVDVGEESIHYDMRLVDARPAQQRELDAQRGKPGGNIVVVVPGHGQTVHGPKRLLEAAAELSRSKIAWCIDASPVRGGDWVRGQAVAHITRDRISRVFETQGGAAAATLVGWSHGGSEGLLAADFAPDLFPQFLGLCPTGVVERHPSELLYSFSVEAGRILLSSARRLDWNCLTAAVGLGWNASTGLVRDLRRSRSPKRLLEDVGWACRRVTGQHLGYPGEVVLLFGEQDTVVRWRDAFPECARPEDIEAAAAGFQVEHLPLASRVEVQVIQGSHAAPEQEAYSYLRTGLGMLDQLGEPATIDSDSA